MQNQNLSTSDTLNEDPYGDQRERMILPTDKGFAFLEQPLSLKKAASNNWNLIEGDLLFPLLSIDQAALQHNINEMASLTKQHDVLLAPHAKTSMSPQIIHKQLQAGVWAITAATLSQVQQLIHMQCERIILANGLLDPKSIRSIEQWKTQNPNLDISCFVDSVEMAQQLDTCLSQIHPDSQLKVFVEIGIPGCRTGCRSYEEAMQLIETINTYKHLTCIGLAGYEGLIKGPWLECKQQVGQYLKLFFKIAKEGFSELSTDPIYLSLGGSAYYDLILEHWTQTSLPHSELIMRPGSYITHDHGHYNRVQNERRTEFNCPSFKPALKLWSKIQSLPEPGLAILNMGRRDVAMEAEFPIPLKVIKQDKTRSSLEDCHIYKTNDQHSYMKIPHNHNLRVGDLIICGISHPSLAFDKWKVIPIIDEDSKVVEFCHTCF